MKLHALSKEVSSRTHHVLAGEDVAVVEALGRVDCVLIARGDCLFFSIDLAEVPAPARRAYIQQQVQKYSPWPEAAHYVADLESDSASVWIWDASWQQQARSRLPEDLQSARCLPEPVMLAPGGDGLEVRSCQQGFDYQVWEAGRLIASRWSRDELAAGEAVLWSRSVGAENAPAANDAGPRWESEPWTEPALDWRRLIKDERALMWGGALLLMLVFCFELGLMTMFAIKGAYLDSHVQTLQESLGDKLQVRLSAERLSADNRALASQLPAYTQLEVAAEFTRLMEELPYQLVDWEYRQGGLQVTLKNAELDSRDVVSSLEAGSFFQDIRIEPGLREGEHDVSLNIGGPES